MPAPAPTIPTIRYEDFHKSHWSDEDQKKGKAVIDFVEHIMNKHDFDYIQKNYGSAAYKQHNRSMVDGIEGILEGMADLTKTFPQFSYEVKHMSVDGDRVTLHSHATMKYKHRGNDKKGLNIIDVWKVDAEGRLVEHWDAVQPLDWFMRLYNLFTGGTIRNSNGVF